MDTFIKTFAGLATSEKLETLKLIIVNCSQEWWNSILIFYIENSHSPFKMDYLIKLFLFSLFSPELEVLPQLKIIIQ